MVLHSQSVLRGVQHHREVTCPKSLKNEVLSQWIVMCFDSRPARSQMSSLKGDVENQKDLYREITLSQIRQ